MVSTAQWDDYLLDFLAGKITAQAIASAQGRELGYVQRRLSAGLRAAERTLGDAMSRTLVRQLILARAAMDKGDDENAEKRLRRITMAARAARDLEGFVARNGRKNNAVEASGAGDIGDIDDPGAELIDHLDRLAAARDQKSLGPDALAAGADRQAACLDRMGE
ncbi:hypothetical protein [Maricaulis sp.]|uniref:hypothetical protein n=1 Tax=Maricaulis sp. TaxID=1486257 RepID=UPI0026396A18|nr:hypothetical protein [Maricaulis sp.]